MFASKVSKNYTIHLNKHATAMFQSED